MTFKFVLDIIRESPLGQSQVQSFICEVLLEAYSEHCKTSGMERFAKIVNSFLPKSFWQGFDYASDY